MPMLLAIMISANNLDTACNGGSGSSASLVTTGMRTDAEKTRLRALHMQRLVQQRSDLCAGTGKTYIAINVARALLAHGANKMLVVTYTNHALDQILEAILDSGLPADQLLRIGGRSCAPAFHAAAGSYSGTNCSSGRTT